MQVPGCRHQKAGEEGRRARGEGRAVLAGGTLLTMLANQEIKLTETHYHRSPPPAPPPVPFQHPLGQVTLARVRSRVHHITPRTSHALATHVCTQSRTHARTQGR